jgi:carboxyl-terminal processing protease
MHRRVFQIAILLLLPLALVFNSWVQPAAALTSEQQLLSEAWRIVNRSYVDDSFNNHNWWSIREKAVKQPLNDREQTYTAIQGMLANLDDPFTRLLKPEQYRSLQVNTSGELTGVGLQIAIDPESNILTVVAPLVGSPADKAGIQPLDRILKIDGTPTSELSLDEAATRMRGRIGTPVTLTLGREGRESPVEIELLRDRIELNPVYAELQSGPNNLPLGYIRLSQFSANATSEVSHAIEKLEKQGAAAYILDLRNNPGGLLQAGIEIARLWLDSGTIVYTVNRQGILGSFEASGAALTKDPLIVLVNKGTASASEILAGALQDNSRAQLVGEKTFGKGLIQSLFDLSDGSGLAVTVAKYETPNHTDINKLGISPDRVVPLDPIDRGKIGSEADLQYQAALQLLKEQTVMAKSAMSSQ